jgi:16S rRNA (cytidine1402-2'-O)-methyltransferase
MSPPTLYLVPAGLGGSPAAVLPRGTLEIVQALSDFVVEDAKAARAFLAACGHPRAIRELSINELNEHTPATDIHALLGPLREGRSLGVLSEAGCPAVADPGASLVALAHREHLKVVPLVGPSSILLALMASGLEGQRFAFHGYLPREAAARAASIREFEARSRRERETQIFIETPYRNDALLAALLENCADETRLCVASGISLPEEAIATMTVADWRRRPPAPGRRPTVFLFLA